MATQAEKTELLEQIKGARTVDFIKPVLETFTKLQMVMQDAKHNKSAKAYLETVEDQYRNQLKFLYMAAAEAFPEDDINPNHAGSSLGPEEILRFYEFKVIVSKKEETA